MAEALGANHDSQGIWIWAPAGLPEVRPGSDLVGLLDDHLDLMDGDIVVVTSKVLSKAEGRVRVPVTPMDPNPDDAARVDAGPAKAAPADDGLDEAGPIEAVAVEAGAAGAAETRADILRQDAITAETERVLARRGPTRIVRTTHGLVLAAAGVDSSNTPAGTVLLLPVDPDRSAQALRRGLADRGVQVGVLISDTAGRAWRQGQTDIAIGAAGVRVIDDLAGSRDRWGNVLAVTAAAIGDEIAGAADLVKGKLMHRPVAVVRGLGHLVLRNGDPGDPGDPGPRAFDLVRAEREDLFGLGTREAVAAALCRTDRRGFPASADLSGFVATLEHVLAGSGAEVAVAVEPGEPGELTPRATGMSDGAVDVHWPADRVLAAVAADRAATAAWSMGWRAVLGPAGSSQTTTFLPETP